MNEFEILKDGGLIVSGMAGIEIIRLAVGAWKSRNQRTEIATDPLNVQHVKECVHKDECREKMGAIEKRLGELEHVEAKLRDLLLTETDNIFNRVNNVADCTSALTGKMDALFEILKHERKP
ncbi:MAG: hypothetical protein FWG50_13075 [Kiritimatiellaeota bacterium]|nr:hypothetical protein [Kiritimatiellota bacterium]